MSRLEATRTDRLKPVILCLAIAGLTAGLPETAQTLDMERGPSGPGHA
ncbi:hypothetical protein [Nioella ostreopsis]|nr:hypothetical protein [Nioella ostreopsis]